MLIQSILVSIWAFMNGRVFNEYFCWIIRGAPLVTGTITGILCEHYRYGGMYRCASDSGDRGYNRSDAWNIGTDRKQHFYDRKCFLCTYG